MKFLSILLLIALPLLFSNCTENSKARGDATFAKNTFEALARGDSKVATRIDWPVFTSQGQNLGASYTAIGSEVEKEKMITSFITQFASSFREAGGSVDSFSNWRVTSHDSQRTEVAADSPTGVLTLIVSERDGVERVSSINFLK